MTRNWPGSFACVVIVIGMGLSQLGCGNKGDRRGDSAGRVRAASDTGGQTSSKPPIDYTKVLESARTQYAYAALQDPVDATAPDEFDDAGDPSIDPKELKFATATLTPGQSAYGRVYGRIISDIDIPSLKIFKDTNYVWQDQTDSDTSKWDFYTIPNRDPSKGKRLKKGKKFTDQKHPGTHLVRAKKSKTVETKLFVAYVFGFCTDDCSSGHCGLQ